MDQESSQGFVFPARPWPEISRSVDAILGEVRARTVGRRQEAGTSRSRSKAGAGVKPGSKGGGMKIVPPRERRAIAQSTAPTSLLAAYHDVTESTIRNIRRQADRDDAAAAKRTA